MAVVPGSSRRFPEPSPPLRLGDAGLNWHMMVIEGVALPSAR